MTVFPFTGIAAVVCTERQWHLVTILRRSRRMGVNTATVQTGPEHPALTCCGGGCKPGLTSGNSTASLQPDTVALLQKMLWCHANCNSEILPSSVCHTSLEVQQQSGTACLSHDGRRKPLQQQTCRGTNTFQSGRKSVTQRWLVGIENVSSSTESPGPLPSRQ